MIIVCCYVIGGGFIAAWYVEAQNQLKPGKVVDLNSIKWIMGVGLIFMFLGSTVLTHLIAEPIGMFLWHRGKSDQTENNSN